MHLLAVFAWHISAPKTPKIPGDNLDNYE